MSDSNVITEAERAELLREARAHAFEEEMTYKKAGASLAQETTKALILVNGGAMVALMTLLGNLKPETNFTLRSDLVRHALTMWSLGLGSAVVGTMAIWFMYDSQGWVASHRHRLIVDRGQNAKAMVTEGFAWIGIGMFQRAFMLLSLGGSVLFFTTGATSAVQAYTPIEKPRVAAAALLAKSAPASGVPVPPQKPPIQSTLPAPR